MNEINAFNTMFNYIVRGTWGISSEWTTRFICEGKRRTYLLRLLLVLVYLMFSLCQLISSRTILMPWWLLTDPSLLYESGPVRISLNTPSLILMKGFSVQNVKFLGRGWWFRGFLFVSVVHATRFTTYAIDQRSKVYALRYAIILPPLPHTITRYATPILYHATLSSMHSRSKDTHSIAILMPTSSFPCVNFSLFSWIFKKVHILIHNNG